MATSTESSKSVQNKYEKYLDERIAQTAQQVKWVELLSFFLVLAIFVFGLLLFLCIVDAWVVELRVWMRWTALMALALGSVTLVVLKVFPFFWHKVNPLYAAKKLEEGRPELKNSVINYLTVDKNAKRKSAKAVQQKMSQAAATDVANIPLDVTVDRSNMIMAGYLLASIVAVFAFYKIFSPKDPFQTIGRVIMPSANLAAPARVQISDIEPGNAKKYFGESVEITARVKGLRETETVKLLVTNESGTRKDYAIAMSRREDSSIFSAHIGEENGLQESFQYRIEAGDALSVAYEVEVRTCPTIFVEKIEYTSPEYTAIPDRLDESPELISGVEGSVAKVTARTNLPIETAYLQLFRTVKSGDSEKPGMEIAKSIRLDLADEYQASCDLTLELDAKRTSQRFSHYQLVFTTKEGDKSENPNRTRIEVIPDIKPEIEILAPREKVIQVPLNQTERLELAAVDPDYGLMAIVVIGENKGNRLFEKVVFRSDSIRGSKGKQIAELPFRPDQFGLSPGDEVIWFASAEDNRAVGPDQVPVPNRARTENYKIVVTAPIKQGSGTGDRNGDRNNEQPPKNDPDNPEQKDNPNKDPNQPPQKQQPQKAQPENGKDGKQDSKNQKGKSGSQSDQTPQKSPGNGDNKNDSKESGSKQSSENNPSKDPQKNQSGKENKSSENQPNSGTKSDGEKSTGQQKEGGGSSGKQSDPSQAQQADSKQQGKSGKKQKSTQNNSGRNQGDNRPSQNSPGGDPNADPKSSQNGSNSNQNQGTRSSEDDPNRAENELTNSQREPGENSNRPNQKPKNSKEAFEKIKDYFDKKTNQRQNPQKSQDSDQAKSNPGKSNQNTGESEQKNNPDKSGNGSGNKSPGKKNSDSVDPQKETGDEKNGNAKPGKEKANSPKKDKSADGGNKNKSSDSDVNQDKPKSAGGAGQEKKKTSDASGNKDPEAGDRKGAPEKEGKAKQKSGNRNQDGKQQGSNEEPSKSNNDGSKKGKGDSGQPKKGKQDSGSSNKSDPRNKESGKGNSEDNKSSSNSNAPSKSGKQTGRSNKKSGEKGPAKSNGSDAQGDEKKNSQSQDAGKGDSKKNGADGKNGKASDSQSKQKSDTQGNDSNQPKNNSGGDTGNVDQATNKSGKQNQSRNSQSNSNSAGNESQADKANLDYARKTTEMVLEKLKDQKERPDEDLLKDLNWTEDELKNFAEKWEAMRQKAKTGSQKDRARFDNALKSLGLKDPQNQRSGANLKNDDKTGYRQKSGTRKVPSDFAKKFRAIQKSQRSLESGSN